MPETSTGAETLSYIRAVNHALRRALEEYPEALVFGEDVGVPGGPYGASRGLHDAFGARVFDTPISESAILGTGIGSAICGMRPIVEIMFADFFFVAFDQVVNQASNVRYVSNGTQACPLTIRSQQGATTGSCAQHSQCIEAILAHIPGIRVGVPAFPDDAFQMLRAAIASDDPVVVLESRALYPRTGEARLAAEVEGLGVARRLREGGHVTVVSWGRAVHECLDAAAELATEGIEVDLIDLRWINPLDLDAVLESLDAPASSWSSTRPTSPRGSEPRSRPARPTRGSGRSMRRWCASARRTSACPPLRPCNPPCSWTARRSPPPFACCSREPMQTGMADVDRDAIVRDICAIASIPRRPSPRSRGWRGWPSGSGACPATSTATRPGT